MLECHRTQFLADRVINIQGAVKSQRARRRLLYTLCCAGVAIIDALSQNKQLSHNNHDGFTTTRSNWRAAMELYSQAIFIMLRTRKANNCSRNTVLVEVDKFGHAKSAAGVNQFHFLHSSPINDAAKPPHRDVQDRAYK